MPATHMVKVLCPENGMKPTWANKMKQKSPQDQPQYRCTKCGMTTHQRAAA